ncbi:MAG: DUF393 domain-containing protein [Pseudomonadales bacterium]|jgi:predicted DCC family thiol-disulfide oxidoreductase YuxK|nr:DUF393 domain-containing protein [Pseudomonadales bacterium]MDA0761074.1 DUF393 domain-containing protein [Pseudomonadota bacterium]MDA0956585.1 DUF393 domain-containing protein [Pseudomonadota bacterium]
MKPSCPAGTLYYDGDCPLCSVEIRHLNRLAADRLNLVNIHSLSSLSARDRQSMLSQLHLQTDDGRLLLGLDATVYAWRQTRFGWLLAWLRWPVIKPIVDAVYRTWATKRYQKRYS